MNWSSGTILNDSYICSYTFEDNPTQKWFPKLQTQYLQQQAGHLPPTPFLPAFYIPHKVPLLIHPSQRQETASTVPLQSPSPKSYAQFQFLWNPSPCPFLLPQFRLPPFLASINPCPLTSCHLLAGLLFSKVGLTLWVLWLEHFSGFLSLLGRFKFLNIAYGTDQEWHLPAFPSCLLPPLCGTLSRSLFCEYFFL